MELGWLGVGGVVTSEKLRECIYAAGGTGEQPTELSDRSRLIGNLGSLMSSRGRYWVRTNKSAILVCFCEVQTTAERGYTGG